ncbi:aryl-sulfate sulfotransferase [Nocardioides conyzicola]|uniref:HYR domain-containing protein n=1 Tax=Nocardioides conyzicola TaxID=1651781 RepID=A0ABP8Y2R4_9ACTN
MRRVLPVLTVCSLAAGVLAVGLASAGSADPPATRTVAITGTGITGTWPAYDDATDRYAIDTSGDSTGTVTVTATSGDPAAVVVVDGVPAPGGVLEVTDLTVGDEVNVQITDAGGTTSQSWIYLPADFPEMHVVADDPGQQPGYTFLTLASFAFTSTFETVVDGHGVPVMVDELNGSDLKVSDADPSQYTVARSSADGYHIVTLDEQWRPVASRRLDEPDGQNSTDFHDSTMLPDGRAVLVGYDSTAHPGQTDAVIQIVDAAGHATFTWNSGDHVAVSDAYLSPNGDYAHINSVQVLANGDILASFRNLSEVMRIATSVHDDYAVGEVEWRLGGKDSDFTFVDDPDGGNCAQHMARIMPNGHLMIFDNGSKLDPSGLIGPQTANMCPDPTDEDSPGTPGIARPQTRVTEYVLDEDAHTATLVWSHAVPGRYAAFAGSQQRLANDNTLVGWSFNTESDGNQGPIVTETTPADDEIWGLRAVGWFSYRATKHDAPDRIAPEISLAGPADGATYDEGDALPPVTFSCTDRGGSNLDECSGTVPQGGAAPSEPGDHTVTVTATDAAGNDTTRTLSYSVAATPPPPVPTVWQPDLRIRLVGGPWKGADRIGSAASQSVTARLTSARTGRTQTFDVWIRNLGTSADRLVFDGGTTNRRFEVRYRAAGRDLTRAIERGAFTTPRLAPRESYKVKVVVTRTDRAKRGDERRIGFVARSDDHRTRIDRVSALVRAVR